MYPSSSAPALVRKYVRSLVDEGVDDALLHSLVVAVHGARSQIFASIAMAELTTFVAYLFTGQRLLLFYCIVHVFVGAARLRCLVAYNQFPADALSRERLVAFDSSARKWATLFALLLGLMCYGLAVGTTMSPANPLGIGCTTGFTFAIVARNAGRPRLLLQQLVALFIPVLDGLLTQPVEHGAYYAFLSVALAISAVMLGQNSYDKLATTFRTGEANRRMARIDMLTGLLNRFAFATALSERLRSDAGSAASHWALTMVDLDRFKEINDSLGHAAGDAVLIETSARLKRATGEGTVIARMGGDEFVILTPLRECGADAARALTEKLLQALCAPYQIGDIAALAGASLGVALYPDHAADDVELMKRADFALYEAKRSGRGCFRLFDASMRAKLDDERLIEADLQTALSEDHFELWFQPIQSIDGGSLRGYEALARWRHPTRGIIPPNQFIAAAEHTGAIVALGELILDKACAQAARWEARLTVAVNVSAAQFRHPERFVAAVKSVTEKYGLDPKRLFLEITESLLLEDTLQTREAINTLADYGVRFSLDDFGVGYSSLSYIQHYPFSTIKLDRRFIESIDSDIISDAIVASVCALAERLHMEVVAEGVETRVQQRALKSLGVRWAQGYLFGRPSKVVSAGATLQLVSSR